MTCDCEYLQFLSAILVNVFLAFRNLDQLSDSLAGLVAVHEGHATVSQYQGVPVNIIVLNGLFDKLYCLFSIVAIVRDGGACFKLKHLHESLDGFNIECFVIHHHNSLQLSSFDFLFLSIIFKHRDLFSHLLYIFGVVFLNGSLVI